MKKSILSAFANFLFRISEHYRIIRVKNTHYIHKTAYLRGVELKGNVHIGRRAKVYGNVYLSGNVSIGDYTTVNGPNVDIYSKVHEVRIGKFCSIARNVSIQEFNHDTETASTYLIRKNLFGEKDTDIVSKGPIIIGNDVWIGSHSVILSGVSIGNGAVIAANSVVTKDVPPYAIAGGVPAKVISYRFDQPMIDALEKLCWWDWDESTIKSNHEFFSAKLTPELLRKFNEDLK